MKQSRKVLGLSLLVFSMFGSAGAMAGTMVSIVGAGVYPQSVDLGDQGFGDEKITGKLGYGGGLMVDIMGSPHFGVEAGAIYLHRSLGISLAGVDQPASAFTANSLYLPLGFRLPLNHVFSIEAGGFYDHALTSGNDSNYGAQGGVRLSFPMSPGTSLFIDARYNYGLKDMTANGVSFKEKDLVLALVGLSFGGGSR